MLWWPSWIDLRALINVDTPGCGTSVVQDRTGHQLFFTLGYSCRKRLLLIVNKAAILGPNLRGHSRIRVNPLSTKEGP